MPLALAPMLALSLAAAPPADVRVAPAPGPLAHSETAEVVAGESDRHLRFTVPVLIEGEGPFDFMVDTGAEATVVTDRVRDRLALESSGSAIVVGMASRVPVELVSLDGLEFAARVFDGLKVPLLEARHVGADGILGLDTLQDLRVLIDFRTDTIAVDDAAALGGNKGYEIVIRARRKLGRLIITEATIDDVRTAIILDTGAQSSVGNLALRRKLRARSRQEVRNQDVNGHEFEGTVDIVGSLRIDDMQLSNLPVMFADGPAFAQLGLAKRPAMILGMRDLRVFDRVAIDFAARQILFDAPRGSGIRPKLKTNNIPMPL
ncbi:MAG: aspartyl protease family protein [Sphingomonadaceae bacterium]|nr:aspartyl protease family protein [Sphingomonadaceae bacterium]